MEEVIFYHKEPTRLLCPWDFPGKNIGVGCRFLLQRIFLTQGSNLCLFHLLHWKAGSLPLTPTGKPQRVLKPVTHEWKNSSKNKWMTSSFSFFNLIFFKWRIIVLQYCVGFCHILTWISHRSIRLLPPETLLPSPSQPSSYAYETLLEFSLVLSSGLLPLSWGTHLQVSPPPYSPRQINVPILWS